MQITIVAQGSRGDVQPYVALGAALQRAGHQVHMPGFECHRRPAFLGRTSDPTGRWAARRSLLPPHRRTVGGRHLPRRQRRRIAPARGRLRLANPGRKRRREGGEDYRRI